MSAPTPKEAAEAVLNLMLAFAENASHIANAKRRLYEAYLSEGFTEAQALELVKTMTGV